MKTMLLSHSANVEGRTAAIADKKKLTGASMGQDNSFE